MFSETIITFIIVNMKNGNNLRKIKENTFYF